MTEEHTRLNNVEGRLAKLESQVAALVAARVLLGESATRALDELAARVAALEAFRGGEEGKLREQRFGVEEV